MTDWTRLTGYDPRSGLTLDEHLAELASRPIKPPGFWCGRCSRSLGTSILVFGFEDLRQQELLCDRCNGYEKASLADQMLVAQLNHAFKTIAWPEWEPSDEERAAAVGEALSFLTSPPVQAPWDYVALQVSGGDVTGVYRPPSYEIVPGHRS